MSQQGLRQASVRAVTGTALDYNGDWAALFRQAGIPDGDFDGSMLTWLNNQLGRTYTSLGEAMQAFATSQGAYNWSSMGTFSASTWTPLNLGAKLKAWWKRPSVSNITLNGSTIASWTDEIGAYVLAQGTAANQPTYSATGYNGGPGAVFDGSNDFMALAPVPAGIPTGASTEEIWVSGSQDALVADTTTRFLVSLGGTATSARLSTARIVASGANVFRALGTNTYISDNAANLSGAHVMRGLFGATTRSDVDGIAGTPSAAATYATGTTRFSVGIASTLTGGVWKGGLGQIIITTLLTDTEASNLNAYLRNF